MSDRYDERKVKSEVRATVEADAEAYAARVTNPAVDWPTVLLSYKVEEGGEFTINHLLFHIQAHINEAEELLRYFKRRVADDISLRFLVEHESLQVMTAEKELYEFNGLRRWLTRGDQDSRGVDAPVYPTLERVLEDMAREARSTVQELCFRDEWKHNGTSYTNLMDNHSSVYAKQSLLRFKLNMLEKAGIEFSVSSKDIKSRW